MKIIVAGGRDYVLDQKDLEKLNSISDITELVSGGAAGVDKAGERWAESRDIAIKVFKPDWKSYGRGAGPVRNRAMAEYADAVVLFPGGKGTASMYQEALKAKIVIFDYR